VNASRPTASARVYGTVVRSDRHSSPARAVGPRRPVYGGRGNRLVAQPVRTPTGGYTIHRCLAQKLGVGLGVWYVAGRGRASHPHILRVEASDWWCAAAHRDAVAIPSCACMAESPNTDAQEQAGLCFASEPRIHSRTFNNESVIVRSGGTPQAARCQLSPARRGRPARLVSTFRSSVSRRGDVRVGCTRGWGRRYGNWAMERLSLSFFGDAGLAWSQRRPLASSSDGVVGRRCGIDCARTVVRSWTFTFVWTRRSS
jgi:hypothetical protein